MTAGADEKWDERCCFLYIVIYHTASYKKKNDIRKKSLEVLAGLMVLVLGIIPRAAIMSR